MAYSKQFIIETNHLK